MPEYPTPITGLPPGRVDVLIVEDERELAEATAEYLDAMGISSHHEPTAEAALDVLSRREAGVVLLDVNLPGDSGFAFCRTSCGRPHRSRSSSSAPAAARTTRCSP